MEILTLATLAVLAYLLGRERPDDALRSLARGAALILGLLFVYFTVLQHHVGLSLFLRQFVDWLQRLSRF
jgi:cytochrome c biogenesis protein CcdA